MFTFAHKTDEEIAAMQNEHLLPEKVYPFTVKDISVTVSKSGNQMLQVRLAVMASNDDQRNIFDYLIPQGKMIFKLKHFMEVIGLADQYEKDCLNLSDVVGRGGNVLITIQKGSAKPDGGFFPDKNSVKDYIMIEHNTLSTEKKEVEDGFNDPLPF